MNRTPSFASTRRRLAGSATHSVFSQHNLRSAAPSSVASSTSAPPAPSEADLFAPVSPSAAPNAADADSNTPTANAQPPQTPPNALQTPSDLPPTPPNTAPTGTKSPISSTSTPSAGTKPSTTPPNTPPTTPTPGSASSTQPHTDAPCGPSAKLAVVPFATWPTVASHSDTPEAERPHWRARLLEHYSPERQVSFGEHPEWCYSSPRPTLRRLRDQLGSETVVTWLCLQLNYAAQLWGTADGLTSHQLRGAAEAIGASYAELNVGEVMVYLCRLRGGRYGKVAYGSLSADAMVSNLPLYMKERREELSQHERRAADRALAEELDARAARCCTYAQYKVLHARARVLAGGDEAEALRLLEERFWETDTGAASPAEAAR